MHFRDDFDLKKAANSFVNPLTVYMMMDKVKSKNHKGIIMTAGFSALAKMVVRYAFKEGIPVLNIVRKENQVKALKENYHCDALNSESATFWDDLQKYIQEHGSSILFEYIGGNLSAQILTLMPVGSSMVIMALLTKDPMVIDNGNLHR